MGDGRFCIREFCDVVGGFFAVDIALVAAGVTRWRLLAGVIFVVTDLDAADGVVAKKPPVLLVL